MTYRYITGNVHEQWLDLILTNSGFGAYFFSDAKLGSVDNFIQAPVNRAKAAVQSGIGRLEAIGKDTTTTTDVKHEQAGILFGNIAKEVGRSISEIRTQSDREATAARDRAFAKLRTSRHGETALAEIRTVLRDRAAKGDPNWPAELDKLVKSDIGIAEAIYTGNALTCGLSDERRKSLTMDAILAHAPEDGAAMMRHVDIGKEADRMQAGLDRLGRAFYSPAHADRATASRVDVNSPLVPPGE